MCEMIPSPDEPSVGGTSPVGGETRVNIGGTLGCLGTGESVALLC